jgi:hypothetical protein
MWLIRNVRVGRGSYILYLNKGAQSAQKTNTIRVNVSHIMQRLFLFVDAEGYLTLFLFCWFLHVWREKRTHIAFAPLREVPLYVGGRAHELFLQKLLRRTWQKFKFAVDHAVTYSFLGNFVAWINSLYSYFMHANDQTFRQVSCGTTISFIRKAPKLVSWR